MQKLEGKTFNVVQDNIEKLKELFPEVLTENKIDINKLRLVLGENIEQENERYEFNWHGKTEAIQISQKQTTGTLRPSKEESINWDKTQNLYIEGDNLEVLRILQNSYRNKVKMIYIDPPYNTGKDFVYKDNFHDNVKNYKENLKENQKSNFETEGRYHTNWLNMMYPRLKLAKNLLKDDGVIFISIDDNEVFNLKKICDEVFGETNFIDMFSWKKTGTPANLSKMTKKSVEYILLYTKSKTPDLKGLRKFSKSTNGLMNQTNSAKTLTFPKNLTETSLVDGRYEKGIYGTEAYRIELLEDTYVTNGVFTEDVILNGKFKWSQEYLDDQIRNKVKIYIKSKAFSPSYEKEEYNPEKPWNIIDTTFGVGTNENASSELDQLMGANFSDGLYPKPVSLIKYLIKMATEDGDLIVDFFSGSGTTAHAVLELNNEENEQRNYIMIQLPEPTNLKSQVYEQGYTLMTDIGKERIRRVINKIRNSKSLKPINEIDLGFKVFKLDDTNLTTWDEKTQQLEQDLINMINPIKDDRIQEDILYEVLLKYGIDLNISIEKKVIEDTTFYSVGMGYLIVCLEFDVSLEAVEEIAKISPTRVVFLDESFGNDTVRTNAQQILNRYAVSDIRVL